MFMSERLHASTHEVEIGENSMIPREPQHVRVNVLREESTALRKRVAETLRKQGVGEDTVDTINRTIEHLVAKWARLALGSR